MFSKDIVTSDAFIEMPTSTQLLYFQLGMEADDDGFVASPKRVARMIGVNDDDLKVLLGKRFILSFPSGIVVIKHWKINNYIQADRYHETKYLEEKKALITKENGAYTECIQDLPISDTQARLGKASLGKSRQGKVSKDMSEKSDVEIERFESFDYFWELYPKKELKKKSREIWVRKNLESKKEMIMDFVVSAKSTDRWRKGYVKQPPTFLNGECWNDDLSSYNDKNKQPKVVSV